MVWIIWKNEDLEDYGYTNCECNRLSHCLFDNLVFLVFKEELVLETMLITIDAWIPRLLARCQMPVTKDLTFPSIYLAI